MIGIVRNNNPFLTYFSLILRDVSEHISKIQDIFITKQTFRYFFLNWDSLHAMLDSHKAWSYKKKKQKKIKAYTKSV